jgi:hypothetical protein
VPTLRILTGKTRSDSKSITVSYNAIQLSLKLEERIHTDSLKKIDITTVNSNDLFEPTKVTITMHSLQSPNRTFRDRLWSLPDTFVMNQTQFYSYFPYDLYKDENDPAKWTKGSQIFSDTFTTREGVAYQVSNRSFIPGWYVVQVNGKDRSGKEFKEDSYIQLYNSLAAYLDPMEGISVDMIRSTAEPGEKLLYSLNTSMNDIWMVKDVYSAKKDKQRSFETLDPGTRQYEINVTEEDRGGKVLNWMFVKHNRFHSGREVFTIPYTNKELTISYETFRDKVLPGSNEKWKVKISGAKKDKVSAEMLAGMYDASLDQFRFHKWKIPSLYETLAEYNGWSAHNSFILSNGYTYDMYKKEADDDEDKRYDQFVFGEPGEYYDIFSRIYRWDYGFSDLSNPRLMRLPKPVLDEDVMGDYLSVAPSGNVSFELEQRKPLAPGGKKTKPSTK